MLSLSKGMVSMSKGISSRQSSHTPVQGKGVDNTLDIQQLCKKYLRKIVSFKGFPLFKKGISF